MAVSLRNMKSEFESLKDKENVIQEDAIIQTFMKQMEHCDNGKDVSKVAIAALFPLHPDRYKGNNRTELQELTTKLTAIINETQGKNRDDALRIVEDNLQQKSMDSHFKDRATFTPQEMEEMEKKLFSATQLGDIHMVLDLIRQGADLNATDGEKKRTPLRWVAEYGLTEIAIALIDNGADVNAADQDDKTPLHCAAENGRMEIALALIEKGAKVDVANKYGDTPLRLAIEKGHKEIALALIAEGAINAKNERGETPLHIAITKGYKEIALALIAKGTNINAAAKGININATIYRDYWDQTPLHVAIQKGYEEIAKALIAKGANINATDDWGQTPLHVAIKGHQTETALALIDKGADVNTTDEEGYTPLYMAILEGRTATALTMIHYGRVPYADIPVIENNTTSEYIQRQYQLATTQDRTASYARGFFPAMNPSPKDTIMARINLFVKGTKAKDMYWHVMTLLCNKKLPQEMVKVIIGYIGLNFNSLDINALRLKSSDLLPAPATIPISHSEQEAMDPNTPMLGG